jgi:hypothetical protein
MTLIKEHLYLIYDIQLRKTHTRIGEVNILIHKETELDKWKNPNDYKHHALDIWLEGCEGYFKDELDAFYVGDIIPSL